MINKFSELFSNSLIILIILPYLIYLINKDNRWLSIALYMFITNEIHSIIKKSSKNFNYEFLKRPIEAKNCSLFSNNLIQGGLPGFPSGHVASTVTFFTGIYLLFPEYRSKIILFGPILSLLMIYSRIQMKCHNLIQTIGGLFLGILIPLLLNKIILL
jgi:membrane-associated phospholipid phosphatase